MTPAGQLVFDRLYDTERVMYELNRPKHRQSIIDAAHCIAGAFSSGHKLLLAGNGGSAAECGHLAAEFTSRMGRERRALPAINLCADGVYLTARVNDYNAQDEFSRLIDAYGSTGDVLLVMSTSGRSANILNACDRAVRDGLHTVGLFGEGGIKYNVYVEHSINIPSASTQHIQEAHLAVCHLLVELVEMEMFPVEVVE